MPALVRFSLSPALLLRLVSSYPSGGVGLKDSSGDWSATKTYISALKHTGFKVYCGSETFLLQTLREGGTGCISATANINGPAIARLASTCSAIFSPSLPFFTLLSSHLSSRLPSLFLLCSPHTSAVGRPCHKKRRMLSSRSWTLCAT